MSEQAENSEEEVVFCLFLLAISSGSYWPSFLFLREVSSPSLSLEVMVVSEWSDPWQEFSFLFDKNLLLVAVEGF